MYRSVALLGACLYGTTLLAQSGPSPVRTVNPQALTEERVYTVPGRTEPVESATLFTRATGIVEARRADIGDVVRQGDVLLQVAVPDLDRAVEAARASVEEARARAENGEALAARAESLFASQAIAQEELEQRRTAAVELRARVRVVEAELARLEEQQRFAMVRAPFDGVVVARNIERGDRVRGDASTAEGWLFRLARVDELRFVINAAPDLALRVSQGDEAVVQFTEYPGTNYRARVTRSSRAFDSTAGTMRLELALPNPDLALPAGLTGSARFTLRTDPKTLLVPTNTVFNRDGQDFLAVVEADKVAFLPVSTGRNRGALLEVRADELSPGTAVIVNPNALLRPGDAVQTQAPTSR